MSASRAKGLIAVALLLFAALLFYSTSHESATYDEPLHIASAMAVSQRGDFRVDPEDPALFKRWLAMGLPRVALPGQSPFWATVGIDPPSEWAWSVQTIFDRPAEDSLRLIDRGRLMMMAVSVLLVGVIAAWAWAIGGPAAGAMAAVIAALEPNLLAAGGLAKNDSLAALGFTLVAVSLWGVGRRVTAGRVAALAAAVALTAGVKYSGVLLAGIVPAELAVWVMGGASLVRRERSERGVDGDATETSALAPLAAKRRDGAARRAGIAALALVACLAMTWFVIWAAYGFRYAPSADATYQFDLAREASDHAWLLTVDRLHLLPSAYTFGLAYTLHSAVTRLAFLLGTIRAAGWWYYFPVALAVKLPVGLLAAAIGPAAWLVASTAGRRHARHHLWTIVCLALPPAIYLAAAMHSSLNIGFRHLLPILPPMIVATGVVLSRWRRLCGVVVVAMLLEAMPAWDKPLTFFNLFGRAAGNGISLLSDSNLDWGQGLIALADWQAAHPGERLYLDYFGTGDPSSYGVTSVNALTGYMFGDPATRPTSPGVIAVSVTHLQGLYVDEQYKPVYAMLRKRTPREVLGGCIYMYDWPGE